jgi:endonuclease/exonuclease/phosphatase family metal-dependent hydrolase
MKSSNMLSNSFINKYLLLIVAAAVMLMIAGCSSTKEVKKEEVPPPAPTPAPPPVVKKDVDTVFTVRIASINLAQLSKRIEISDLDELNAQIRKEKIDILALQGVSRYPNVATRIDVLDSLSARCDMRQIFGETIEISGRQNGNAVLSTYPIRLNENSRYEGLKSKNFEAALQTVVDCGVRDVIVVSTGLPDPLTAEDKPTVANKMSAFGIQYMNEPMIITGNLPSPEELRATPQYNTLKLNFDKSPRIWYSIGNVLKLRNQRIATTPVGAMTVAEFELLRKPEP